MVQVRVAEGLLEGEVLNNEFGRQFYSFKGIPYAEPPLGNLRFKAPVPKKPWDEIRNAKEFGSVSIQFKALEKSIIGSEDCLYLNVYTPDLNPKTKLPVMVWLHGGAFAHGSGNDDRHGPEFLIRKDIILVTINYRIDALGFLCLDTEEIPGNAGMKDQVTAFRWVKKNIHNFGGDTNNITIFGESAGGASISYHLVSPMSKGLFNKAIVQSGTLICWWAQAFEPRERALKLAKQLGCTSENDRELGEFFKTVPAEKLVNPKLPISPSAKIYERSFGIAEEKDFGDTERFFYGDPIEMLKKGIHENVKVLTGYTEHDGIIVFRFQPFGIIQAQANEFKEFFVPNPIQMICPVKDRLEVGRRVKEYYFGNAQVCEENLDNLISFLNWDMVVHGGQIFAKLVSNQTDVYLYKFTCKSKRNLYANMFGLTEIIGERKVVSHVDDLFYLFPFSISKIIVDKNSEEFTHIDRVTTLWTNFAKYGNPTPDDSLGVKWMTYTLEKKIYLNIGNQLEVCSSPDAEEEAFWDSIFYSYLPSYTV